MSRPVLVAGALEEELLELLVAHPPCTLRGSDARLLHRTAHRLRERTVDAVARRGIRCPAREGDQDAGPLRLPVTRGGIAQVDAVAEVARQPAVDLLVREEHERL